MDTYGHAIVPGVNDLGARFASVGVSPRDEETSLNEMFLLCVMFAAHGPGDDSDPSGVGDRV